MEYDITLLPQSRAKIVVFLSPDEFALHLQRAALTLSSERVIPGFRPGTASIAAVKRTLGEDAFFEQAAALAVKNTYPDVLALLIRQGRIPAQRQPIGAPEASFERPKEGEGFRYEVLVSLLPEVLLPEYLRIAERAKKERNTIAVSDEEIVQVLAEFQKSRAQSVLAARAALAGDGVEVDIELRENGILIENGISKNHPLTIGERRFLPGFEEELIGLSAGEEKTFSLDIPRDWPNKASAGKRIEVRVEIRSVYERHLPELTDEFAKGLGEYESLDQLRARISDRLKSDKEKKERERIRMLMVDRIAERSRIEMPDILVSAEIEKMMNELRSGIEGMGITWEQYLLHIKKNVEDLKKEWKEEAIRRARIALVLREIARKEGLEPSEAAVSEEIEKYVRHIREDQDKREVDRERLGEYIKGTKRSEKVFEFLEDEK